LIAGLPNIRFGPNGIGIDGITFFGIQLKSTAFVFLKSHLFNRIKTLDHFYCSCWLTLFFDIQTEGWHINS